MCVVHCSHGPWFQGVSVPSANTSNTTRTVVNSQGIVQSSVLGSVEEGRRKKRDSCSESGPWERSSCHCKVGGVELTLLCGSPFWVAFKNLKVCDYFYSFSSGIIYQCMYLATMPWVLTPWFCHYLLTLWPWSRYQICWGWLGTCRGITGVTMCWSKWTPKLKSRSKCDTCRKAFTFN